MKALFEGDCQAADFDALKFETCNDHDGHDHGGDGGGGPPECVSACNGDICCDGGICSGCSTSSCSQDDLATINSHCASSHSGGDGNAYGNGYGNGGYAQIGSGACYNAAGTHDIVCEKEGATETSCGGTWMPHYGACRPGPACYNA